MRFLFNYNFFHFLVIKTLDLEPDPDLDRYSFYNAGSESELYEYGSETLPVLTTRIPVK
jgi:hypothetical protein